MQFSFRSSHHCTPKTKDGPHRSEIGRTWTNFGQHRPEIWRKKFAEIGPHLTDVNNIFPTLAMFEVGRPKFEKELGPNLAAISQILAEFGLVTDLGRKLPAFGQTLAGIGQQLQRSMQIWPTSTHLPSTPATMRPKSARICPESLEVRRTSGHTGRK